MRYAKYNGAGVIVNTMVCNDPDFAARLGYVEYPYPEKETRTAEPTDAERIAALETRISSLETLVLEMKAQ